MNASIMPDRFVASAVRCTLLALLALAAPLAHAAADENAAQPIAPSVLDPAVWQVTPTRGNSFEVRESGDRSVIVATGRSLMLSTLNPTRPNTRITAVFRATDDAGGSITISIGLSDATNTRERGQYVSASVREGGIAWSVYDPNSDDRRHEVRGSYRQQFKVNRSLAWPEWLRRNVEADMVESAATGSRWVTLDLILRDGGYEAVLNGIPLATVTHTEINTTALARVSLSPNIELASLSTQDVPPQDNTWVYRPVSLQSLLNASKIDGKTVDRSSLGSGDELEIAGVPFVLPTPQENGDDHVDIGTSWFRQGNLDGRYSGRGGDAMSGRWVGAMIHDPARLALRLPMARYSALHLLAAADNDKDSVPVITAQFYRPQAGMPKNFAARVPLFSAKSDAAHAVPVRTTDGGKGTLYLVTIPVDPAALVEFDDLEYIEVELTKEVQLYRASPDPMYYSFHAAGLPSSVHVYALTAQRPAIDVDVKPDAYGDIWTAPEKPGYTVTLSNRQGGARTVKLELTTTSLDGKHTTTQDKSVKLPADKSVTVAFPVKPEAYGYHDVTLNIVDGKETWALRRSLAYLHEDTRERGNWDFGRGPLFGFYNWRGGHHTPSADKQLMVMAKAGIEVVQGNFEEYERYGEDTLRMFKEWQLFTMKLAGGGDHYTTARFANDLKKDGYDAARQRFLEEIEKRKSTPGPHSRPTFISWFPEPSIGPVTHGIFPEYIGEPPIVFSDYEQTRYELFRDGFVEGAKIMREHYPHIKNLMPHGDPTFVVHFLQNDPDLVAPLLDGVTVDIPVFERLPEQQFHQVSLHRIYMARKAFADVGNDNPFMPMYEGPCVPSGPGALTDQEQADLTIRDSLILQAYGVYVQNGGFPAFDTASYWGEQHYGFGVLNRIALETPKPAYAALATMTRHLNRANFDGYVSTGSHSAYALRFKHYKTGKLIYAMWTVRGRRPVTLEVADPKAVRVYDQMDNLVDLKVAGNTVTFTIDPSPCYVEGLDADPAITLGEPDHSDATPAPVSRKIANLGDGSWSIVTQTEAEYEESHTPYIIRYPSPMTVQTVDAPEAQGGKALAVHFPDPEKDRVFVPYYSVLTPKKPVEIPGKASHLGLWVKGSSDWGRAIYFCRDAKGELWINVGTRGAWNCDDLHSWMSFNFDGWRYLRMEMPANSAYDLYREAGSAWWGPYSSGDGNIDLPLTLEKIVVERRTHVMYVNAPEPADRSDVLLADLYAEYASEADAGDEAVRLSRVRMPVPRDVKGLDNPIARLKQEGVGAPIAITHITLPQQEADGTRCFVHFPTVADAVTYDVWASGEEDGSGALQLGKAWKQPGQQVRGLRPNQDFYLFVTWTDAAGNVSKPSEPFKINLEDFFGMK